MVAKDLTAFQSRYPGLTERIYFASQCLGPVPAAAFDDLDAYRRSIPLRKSAMTQWVDRIEELIGLIETLLGAPPGSVALRDSATGAQAAIAAAIAPRPGKNRIVISRQDFHSTRYLWKAQAARGFAIDELEILPGRCEIDADQYVNAIDERTALVEAALVSPRNGVLLDVRPVVEAARAHGAIVVLDVYQAVGAVPIAVASLGADVVVGGVHKWLGGAGTGLAFLYVRPALAEALNPAYPGWLGRASWLSFGEEYEPAPGARRFQQGTIAIEPVFTARAGIRLVLEMGIEHIRAQSLALTGRLMEQLLARGIPVTAAERPERRGPMLCLPIPDAAEVEAALSEQGIDVDSRPGAGLRLGPHACYGLETCDRVADAIAAARHA
jgi:kynureninase